MSRGKAASQWEQIFGYRLGVGLIVFTMYTSATIPLQPTPQRGIFLLAIVFLALLRYPLRGALRLFDLALAVAGIISIGYLVLNWEELAYRAQFEPTLIEYLFGVLAVGVTLEVSRRAAGLSLSLCGVAALLYALFGSYLPSPFGHRGFSLARVVSNQYLTHEGLFSSLLGTAATLVTAFVIFGCLAQHVGVTDVFMRASEKLTFGAFGGPGKLEVVSSALFGTISGSSTANVVATGTTTIPLMKRAGFTPTFAAAVEAASSTGGQIMPPIMGVAAFLMAEVTGIPYATIALAAVVPAILYYVCVYLEVDLEARKLKLQNLPETAAPSSGRSLWREIYLLAPLVVLIYLLFVMYSPTKAAFWSCVSAVAVSLPRWRALIDASRLRVLVKDFNNAVVVVGLSCATSGIIVGALNLTGASLQLSYGLVELAGENRWLLMVFVMLLCIILGTGLPTPAAYAVAAAFAAPMLTMTGVPRLSAHLFVLFYACLSSITPPVATAAFAAAGIAGAPPMRTGWVATKLGLSAFIVPFVFADNTALLIGQAPVFATVVATLMALLGVGALSVSVIGYYRGPIGPLERIGYLLASILLIHPSRVANLIGLAIGGGLLAHHVVGSSHSRMPGGLESKGGHS